MGVDVFGQDIKLDDDFQAMVAANGELVLTDGPETGVQDIRIMLSTPFGTLFYDTDVGSLIHEWVKDENTEISRMALASEIKRLCDADARVVMGSTVCVVSGWDEKGITLSVSFEFITEDHPFNLVISVNSDKVDMVIKDVSAG